MTLHPCASCRRHIEASAATCPFCASPQRHAMRSPLMTVAKLSRAAVFAGAAACYTGSTTTATLPPNGSGEVAAPFEPAAPAAGMSTLHGIVTRDRRPLAGVAVHARSDRGGAADTTTGAKGEYELKDLAPGRWSVDVDDDEYDPDRYTRRPQEGPPPRPPSPMVELQADHVARQDIAITAPPEPTPDTGPCCKPYGAPPARRRIV